MLKGVIMWTLMKEIAVALKVIRLVALKQISSKDSVRYWIIPRQINSNPITNYCRVTPRSDKAIFRSNLSLQQNSKIKDVNKLIFFYLLIAQHPLRDRFEFFLLFFALKKIA